MQNVKINSITIFHQNIQHLESRKESLEIVLEEIKPNIVVLTEHNMKQLELDRFNLSNFYITSSYSRSTTSGGGVVILSRGGLNSKALALKKIEDLTDDKLFECCMAKYKFNKWSFVLVGVYRKPQLQNLEFLSRLDKLIELLSALKDVKDFVIAGDFNLNVLNCTPEIQHFKNILKSHSVHYLVDFPTRVTANTSTAIDNILTNIDKSLSHVIGIVTALSDHDGQILELTIPGAKDFVNNYEYTVQRDFSVNNMNVFNCILSRENWMPVYLAKVEDKFKLFNSIFHYNFDLVFTKKKVKKYVNKSKFNWINQDLVTEQKDIVKLTKQAKSSGNVEMLNYTKFINMNYKRRLINAKKTFYDQLINKSDNVSKKTWEIINLETGKKSKGIKDSPHEIRIHDEVISDPLSISNCFNNYFVEVIENLINGAPSKPQLKNNQNVTSFLDQINIKIPFRCRPVDEEELGKIISTLKNKSSSGHDEVPLKLIKYVGKSLLKPLVHLINSSLITGIFPNCLKISKVVPIYKKGERHEIGNYRPVSVLPSISKIYERVMYNRLVDHLQNNNLFDEQQHGFRKGKSTTTALLNFSETIIDAVDNGNNVAGIFMDLSKAFDSISHEILLHKLKDFGILNNYLNWFRSYLSERMQYVEIMSKNKNTLIRYRSETLTIKHGVPQGSILGPLLFLCYVQGMPSILKNILGTGSRLILYADDANLVTTAKSHHDLETACQEQMKIIETFFIQNSLFLNGNKTNQIIFSTKQNKNAREIDVFVEGNKIESLKLTKFLGVEVDNNLSWDQHIQKLASKISSGLYVLRRMSLLCSLDTLKTVYFAHIHSHISYGLAVYGGTSKNNLDTILIFQKKALRILLNLEDQISVKNKFSELNILTVYDQYILECIMCVRYKYNELDRHSSIHSYNTRHRNNLNLAQHRLSFFTKKATHFGSKCLNHLPENLKSKINNKNFKHLVKNYLLKKSCYSKEEFFSSS